MKAKLKNQSSRRTTNAFTFFELLVVVALIGFCTLFIFPAMARSRGDSAVVRCMNNLRQLTYAWKMYANENNGLLVWSYPGISCSGSSAWCLGNASKFGTAGSYCYGSADPTGITKGRLWPYVKSMEAYKCPSDKRMVPASAPFPGQPILRSYSMNCWMAGRSYGDPSGVFYTVDGTSGGSPDSLVFQFFVKDTHIEKPAQTWVFIDENLSTINDGMFLVDMGTGSGLLDVPGNQHNVSYPLSFADAHVELYKLKDSITQKAISGLSGYKGTDWMNLTNVTTHRR